jgi:DNA-binding MarR family transcriptional regulator
MTDPFVPEDLADAKMSTKLVYRALRQADDPLTRRELKIAARCSGSSITRALNRLEQRDHLRRTTATTPGATYAYGLREGSD